MKKTASYLLLVLVIFSSSSCKRWKCIKGSGVIVEKVFYIPESFSGIQSEGNYEVYLIHDTVERKVIVSTDDNIASVAAVWVNHENDLVLNKSTKRCLKPTDGMVVYVHNDNFTNLELRNKGLIKNVTPLNQSSYQLSISGDGTIDLEDLDGTTITALIDGTGNIFLDSHMSFASASYVIKGSGDIFAITLDATTVVASIDGNGRIECYPIQQLIATISGEGDIEYRCVDGPSVSQSIPGSGRMIPQCK